jgi:putative PEP-CTERM system histidine kinase
VAPASALSITPGILAYAIASLAFFALTIVLAIGWRGRVTGLLFLIAALVSTLWSALGAATQVLPWVPPILFAISELLRDAAWLIFLWWLLWDLLGYQNRFTQVLAASAAVLISLQLVLIGLSGINNLLWDASPTLLITAKLAIAVIGLMLIEHVYRFTRPEQRWSSKYLCLGLGGLFAFDFYLYSDALLFLRIQPDLLSARGFVNALIVPLLAVSAARNPNWSLDVYVSRQAVFHTTTLLGAGAYLILMAAAGYYLKVFGGEWGAVLQTAVIFAGIIALLSVILSGQLRARLKVFISKHFFNYRYDYRDEWLRFTQTLSADAAHKPLDERIVAALANTVNSPGGLLWTREGKHFQPEAGRTRRDGSPWPTLTQDESLIEYLERSRWVIILNEYRQHPEHYDGLRLPDWLEEDPRAWLIIPLHHEQDLQGIVLLYRQASGFKVDWEVRDLLKTAGQQAASHLAQMQAVQALTQARQFESFNRLSAYVVHDLKNLIAQLSLVVSNASRHGDNPEFLRDAIGTIDNAVARMNRLMQHLRSGGALAGQTEPLDAAELAQITVVDFADRQPPVTLTVTRSAAPIQADADRLRAVLGHLIQNALDATPKDGQVHIEVHCDRRDVLIDITDTGCGMDQDFIRQRLFRPFDTTKGLSGMGIGAFESREYLRTLGGDLEVSSQLQHGSRFRMRIPQARSHP